jgi:hypothetical protein
VVLLERGVARSATGRRRRKCAPGSTACFAFRAPPATAGALRRVSARRAAVVGDLANNHARDDGDVGCRITIDCLNAEGVHGDRDRHPGDGRGHRRGRHGGVPGLQRSGPAPTRATSPPCAATWRAPPAAYPLVVVTMHMGAEGVARAADARRGGDLLRRGPGERRWPSPAPRPTRGRGLVFGHGPHVMRAWSGTGGGSSSTRWATWPPTAPSPWGAAEPRRPRLRAAGAAAAAC